MAAFTDRRCIWCHGSDGQLRTIEVTVTDRLGRNPHPESVTVHPRHAPETRSFLELTVRHGGTFVGIMAAATGVALVLGLLIAAVLDDVGGGEEYWAAVLYGPWAILTGLLLVRFPFATPETVKWLGIARSRLLVRALGWLTAGIGGWILTTVRW